MKKSEPELELTPEQALDPKTLKAVRKMLKDQLDAVIEGIKNIRSAELDKQRWLEKQLGRMEEELVEMRVELKKLKAKNE